MLAIYLKILFLAFAPVVEMRGSIPLALLQYNLPLLAAMTISIIGAWLGGLVTILLLGQIEKLIDLIPFFKKIKEKIFLYTRQKHEKNFRRLGLGLIFLLAAVPIPIIGGSYTAGLVAYLFNPKKSTSLFLIFLGLIIQAVLIVLSLKIGKQLTLSYV